MAGPSTDLHILRLVLDNTLACPHLDCAMASRKKGQVHTVKRGGIRLWIDFGGVGQDFPTRLLALRIAQRKFLHPDTMLLRHDRTSQCSLPWSA